MFSDIKGVVLNNCSRDFGFRDFKKFDIVKNYRQM